MIEELKKIEKSFQETVKLAKTPEEIESLRVQYLGRERGVLTSILRSLKNLAPGERKKVGARANQLRQKMEEAFAAKKNELEKNILESVLQKERLDVTRPGIKPEKGHLHPLTKIIREMTGIFSNLGFETVEGPEVESEWYNFDALNIPDWHPAREMWDTLWLKTQSQKPKNQKLLLRTHTSPVQVRYMEKHNPPIRIIVPGRVYRYEATDASHNIQFWQLEGLMVDKNISIANFKAIIQEFFSRLFKTTAAIRLRPSYFPFTEPSFEVDISCIVCGGIKNKKSTLACSVCKETQWLELAGAGMVHPYVFKAAGYNPKDWQGFAFGLGIDRLAMMKYKIPDIRLLYAGDLRFLKQF